MARAKDGAPRDPKKLTDAARRDVVIYYATFHSGDEVRAMLKERHQLVDVPAPVLSNYNAGNPGARAAMPKKWLALFDEVRAQYYAEEASIPIANRARRLRIVNELVEKLLPSAVKVLPSGASSPNLAVTSEIEKLMTFVARDKGGAFTNVRVLEHEARGALAQFLGCDPSELPEKDGSDADA